MKGHKISIQPKISALSRTMSSLFRHTQGIKHVVFKAKEGGLNWAPPSCVITVATPLRVIVWGMSQLWQGRDEPETGTWLYHWTQQAHLTRKAGEKAYLKGLTGRKMKSWLLWKGLDGSTVYTGLLYEKSEDKYCVLLIYWDLLSRWTGRCTVAQCGVKNIVPWVWIT